MKKEGTITISKAAFKKLSAIYDAVAGIASEQEDPFRRFYKGGSAKMYADFESVLEECGVKFQ